VYDVVQVTPAAKLVSVMASALVALVFHHDTTLPSSA
jgi:hypothetical protein